MVTIKDKKLKILTCLVILVLGISLVPVASADSPPSLPNVFKGKLITEGADVPVGTIVSAYIDSELVGSKTIKEAGKYQLDVSGSEEDNGKKIIFKLGLVESEPVSVTYQHGAAPVDLDLTFRGDFVPPVIESCSASPVRILNDGKDYSVVRAKVSDERSGVMSVTLDLTPIGKGVVALTPESGDIYRDIYTCDVTSTLTGEFKFALTATDYFGNKVTDKDSISITVVEVGSTSNDGSTSNEGSGNGGGSSKSSGSSGGGAGGSPEPQSNVEAKELSQVTVTSGKHITFNFPNGVTCIRYVKFDAKKTLGKVTTIVEMLKGQSKLVPNLPEGKVYKNVNIWVGSGGVANSDNIENAVIGFRVDKTWLKENGVDVDDKDALSLWYYNKEWIKLDTWKLDESNNTYVYYEAKTPGFGSFAIVAASKSGSPGSVNIEPASPEGPENDIASEPSKPSSGGWRSVPGFESVVVLGTIGAAYCILRKKF